MVFSYEIYKIFKNTFLLQNTTTLVAASGSKLCKPMKRYTTEIYKIKDIHWKFILRRKKWYIWTVLLVLVFLDNEYSSEVFQTLLAVPHLSKVAVAEMFCEKDVLENFANHRCFPVNFAKFSRTPFFIEHLWWLLLKR